MTSCGTLEVRTPQERTYIRITSFTALMAGSPGAKNIPILAYIQHGLITGQTEGGNAKVMEYTLISDQLRLYINS